MARIAYVNGQYVRHQDAAVHIEDRGYQFADGVYEVFAVMCGNLIGEVGHLERLTHHQGAPDRLAYYPTGSFGGYQ